MDFTDRQIIMIIAANLIPVVTTIVLFIVFLMPRKNK